MDQLAQQLMMLDIDGILTHHHATTTDPEEGGSDNQGGDTGNDDFGD